MQDPLQASLRTLTLYHIGDNSAFVKLIKYFLFYRDAHCGAKYFTYDTEKSKCRCKPEMNLDVTRKEKTGRISGNVDCVFEITSSIDFPPPGMIEMSSSIDFPPPGMVEMTSSIDFPPPRRS